MSNYTREIELALIEYSNTEDVDAWFNKLSYKVDVKDIFISRALLYAKSKESFLDPTKPASPFFSAIFKQHIMGDVMMLRMYLIDRKSMREPTQIAWCEKILKQSNRQNKLEQLL